MPIFYAGQGCRTPSDYAIISELLFNNQGGRNKVQMVKLHEAGAYLVNGTELVTDEKELSAKCGKLYPKRMQRRIP